MTSVLRRYSQLDARTRYFVSGQAIETYFFLSGATTGVVDISDVSSNGPATVIGPLLKDLGRVVYVYDSSGYPTTIESPLHVATLRQVQEVNGIATEGVGGDATNSFGSYWIVTWQSGGGGLPDSPLNLAVVSRLG
jgi:hypothetical protein